LLKISQIGKTILTSLYEYLANPTECYQTFVKSLEKKTFSHHSAVGL